MEILAASFNVVLVVFIVATMLAAGLRTPIEALTKVLGQASLVLPVLLANLVVVPLLGWGVALLFQLPTAAFVALLLVASSPGAPFGAKLAMMQKGDVVSGPALQVLLAAIGSITFPLTASLLLTSADVGGGISLPVRELILSVAVLQLVPFGIGLALLRWSPRTAGEWAPGALRSSNIAFLGVLALGTLGSWQQIVGLIGSRTILAAATFTVLAGLAGLVMSSGPRRRRTTTALIAPMRNAGPVFAAVAVGLNGDPDVLAAVTGILLVGLVVAVPVAARLAKDRTDEVGGAMLDASPR
jgi:BASS family bile acid:Na+ symporter